MTRLRLSVLGPFRLEADTEIALPSRKAQALLAYLALPAGRPHRRDKLASLLWADRGDTAARHNLRQALSLIAKAIRPASKNAAAMVSSADRIAIDPAAFDVDAARLEGLVHDASPEALLEAVKLCHGDLLDGLNLQAEPFEEWLTTQRSRFRELAVQAHRLLLEHQISCDNHEAAIMTALRLLALDATDEDAHRKLMQLYLAQGRKDAALRQFQICVDTLQRELGLAPDAETRALHRSIAQARSDLASQSRPRGPVDGPSPETPDESMRPAIAVLPFANMSGDPEQEYFADGLTEDIMTDLARLSTLFVVARNTTFALKGKAVRIPQTAKELSVGYVLEGSVRKVGDRVRITAQLVDGRTGGHLWAQRYDRRLDDIFGLQDEISRNIVDALTAQLQPGTLTGRATRSTTTPEAYEYYLKGRSFFLRGLWGRRTLTVARQMFAKTAETDPNYARAYAGQAYCECYLLWLGDRTASLEAATDNIARALELAPDAPETHAAKGLVLWAAGRYGEAKEPFERALALGPSLFEAHLFGGRNCRVQGQHERAASLFERAADLQPNDFKSLGLAADAYRSLGRREEMLSAARRGAARIAIEVSEHPDNAHALAFGAGLLAELGDDARAEDWATRAISIDPVDPTLKYNLACTYIALAKPELALEWLQRIAAESAASRRWLGAWMDHDSSIDALRDHPRFGALAERLVAAGVPSRTMGQDEPAIGPGQKRTTA
jgi:TolB-like protein/DNA-binding SARP family transcriptional activator/Tfp pilus assembly protein PilF